MCDVICFLLQPSRFSYNAAVSACAWSGDYDTVAQLMQEMTADGIAPVRYDINPY
jgi:pentatricopeptide repeat protein